MMKRVMAWGLIGLGAVVLAGCGAKTTAPMPTSQAQPAASKASASSQSQASAASKQAQAPWSAAKKQRLSTFMRQWSSEMGQHWIGTYDDQPLDYYGVDADALTANDGITMTWGQQPVQM